MEPFSERPTIGFIGLGVMGRSMASHLLTAGYALHVFTRTRATALPLIEAGAVWEVSPGALAARCTVVMTMVGYPADVEALYLGEQGLVQAARPGTLLIDMTTSSPKLAQTIAAAGAARGLEILDAPVSGGDVGAREARLSIMVGGESSAFQKALPLLRILGTTIEWQGPAGAGQHTKMANQIAVAGSMIGTVEALAYAEHAGLDLEHVLASISGGAAASWSLLNLGPRILRGDFKPGFYVKHFVKDMRIALDSARETGCPLPGLERILERYEALVKAGHAESGTQALACLYLPVS